jgi:hypothetical protein
MTVEAGVFHALIAVRLLWTLATYAAGTALFAVRLAVGPLPAEETCAYSVNKGGMGRALDAVFGGWAMAAHAFFIACAYVHFSVWTSPEFVSDAVSILVLARVNYALSTIPRRRSVAD